MATLPNVFDVHYVTGGDDATGYCADWRVLEDVSIEDINKAMPRLVEQLPSIHHRIEFRRKKFNPEEVVRYRDYDDFEPMKKFSGDF